MSISISGIDPYNGSTHNDLIALANNLAAIISSNTITIDNSANGSVSSGNAFISGILGVLTLSVGTLKGGNVQSAANLAVSSNLICNSSTIIKLGNVTVNSTTIAVGSGVINSSAFSGSANNCSYLNAKADSAFGQLNTAATWIKTQTAAVKYLANNTGANYSNGNVWQANVAGTFVIANPSTNCASGSYINFIIYMTAAGTLSFGNMYKGLSSYIQSTWTTGTMIDHLTFFFDGTNIDLVGIGNGVNQ